MNVLSLTAADVIHAVIETLDVICKARGIELEDLDEALFDRLLLSSYQEYFGSRSVDADVFGGSGKLG